MGCKKQGAKKKYYYSKRDPKKISGRPDKLE